MSWRRWPTYSAACRRDVQRLLQDGRSLTAYQANPTHGPGPANGSWAWKLEREAARVHQVSHVIACANGTLALTVLLKVLYPHGGTIVTTAFTFSATVAAILQAGLTPAFADVSLSDGLLDLSTLYSIPDAVGWLPVDLFGKVVWWGGRGGRGEGGGWVAGGAVVVDACQSVGISPVFAHGVWSFNGRKNVPAGEGGAIFTRDASVATRCRLMLGHAENFVEWIGGNGHLNEVSACLAFHGMRAVRQRNAHRTKMATVLNEVLRGAPVITPDLTCHALYMYPLIVTGGMTRIADRLTAQGISCQRGYIQPPLHQYPAFRQVYRTALPNTESLSRDRLLLFPQVTPTTTRWEMEQLGAIIREML